MFHNKDQRDSQRRDAEQQQLREELEQTAAMMRSLLLDTRYVRFRIMMEEARRKLRMRLRMTMEREERPSEVKVVWMQSRIETLTDFLETPEVFALALAEQDESQSGVSRKHTPEARSVGA